ncbi:indolepyruvate ferredoxin oxidoreductase family protein [Spirillospora sp. CA-255316]
MAAFSLDDRYVVEDGSIYVTGIQALVRMLLDRARHERREGREHDIYVTGYEGSPLAGYDLELGRRKAMLADHRILHQPALNEELAATALAGTQLAGQVAKLRGDGVTGIWYGKAPGLDRATDAIRHANLTGTSPRGGVVALVGDDPSAKSSSFPCSSEMAIADLQMPALYPADAQDVLEHGMHAVELSRACGLWSAMKIATNVADGAAGARVVPRWTPPDLTGLGDGLVAYRHSPHARLVGPALAALERSLVEQRIPLAIEYIRRSGLNRISGATGEARIGVVASGKTYLDVRQALGALGLDDRALGRHGIRLLKLGAIWPLEPRVVREFADGLHEIIVVEDKRPFIESGIKEILYGVPGAPRVHGKWDPEGKRLFSGTGELDPDAVAAGLARRLRSFGDIDPVHRWQEERPPTRITLPLAARTPYFCSGCPHNSSTKVPDDALVGGGIGCHAMVLMMPEAQTGNVTGLCQMGGEGAQWIGMAPFVDTRHFIQNIGDGTFAHSGSLAVRAAAAAGVNITYKLLYNSAVAMTGGQDAVGAMPVERIAALLLLEGARRVVITTERPARVRRALRSLPGRFRTGDITVRHRDDLVDAQSELAAVPGVTVLIHDQECAAEKRRKRKRGKAPTPHRRVVINERVCEGCGDCGRKSNCLSVQPVTTRFGRKTRIHQSSCNLDFSCLDGDCPSFVTVEPGDSARRSRDAADVPDSPPEPERRPDAGRFSVRITGIGGTGIVTVAQILATAATIDGLAVRTLDQTGLAQKGGAVISDLKIGRERAELAAKLAEGECDLYLGCDSLVATDPANLKVTDPARTVAVVSTAEVPTGGMIVDPGASYPAEREIRSAIDGEVARAHYLAADRLAENTLDDAQFANIILVGAAYQAGTLPITAEAIEKAIELNGVAVEANIAAFRHGRRALLADGAGTETGGDTGLARILDVRAADLTAYQNERYAAAYSAFIERVRDAEDEAVPGSEAFTEAVARNLYKLMAYKDEYEVARLCLDPAFHSEVADRFGAGSKIKYRLHPPVLRALGMQRKIALGPWAHPVFHALYAMRALRGTRLDPFGRAAVRRTERELVSEYRTAVDRVLSVLDEETLPIAVEIAELPDLVRGYEDIKLGNVAIFRERLEKSLALLPETHATRHG